MKNTEKKWRSFASAKLIIAIVAVIGFGFTACGDGSGNGNDGGSGSIGVTVKNNNSDPLTNIKITAIVDNKEAHVLYDSGTISIATGATHSFTANNISWSLIGTQICRYYVTVGGTERTGNIVLGKNENPNNFEIKDNGFLGNL
ncbi:MAG: hypothetical protein FWB89_08450 [Treponema sp.]|nr:hypothetical protein [Treponema sp.]